MGNRGRVGKGFGRLGPVSTVECAVLNGFCNVLGLDLGSCVKVGDRPRYFQYAVVGAGAEPLLRHGALQQSLALGGKFAVSANLASPHLGVGVNTLSGG